MAVVYVEQSPLSPNASVDYTSEVNDIKSLAKQFISQGAELTVTHIRKDDLIKIAVIFTDPAQAADICNRIAETYVAKTKAGVIKTLLEKAHEPSRPI
jgi:capsular polysaccharide biosynthesis protein